MATETDELKLFKYNPDTDGENIFSIQQALNENWDKIDTFATAIKSLKNLSAEGEKRFEDILAKLDKKLEAQALLAENGYIKFNRLLSWMLHFVIFIMKHCNNIVIRLQYFKNLVKFQKIMILKILPFYLGFPRNFLGNNMGYVS